MSAPESSVEPLTTLRQCIVKLVNNYGHPITVHEFKHSNGLNDWSYAPGQMNNGDVGAPQATNYQTGIGSATDHWYVKFTDNTGITFDNNPSFDCSMESEDEGRTVFVRIKQNLKVELSDGDFCEEDWKRA